MSRVLLLQASPNVKVTIPDEAKVTFGPFTPPGKNGYSGGSYNPAGTIRVYADHSAKADIIFVHSGVTGYRDLNAVSYEEEVAREEGATLWKSDEHGYTREEKVQRESAYVAPQIEAPKKRVTRRRK